MAYKDCSVKPDPKGNAHKNKIDEEMIYRLDIIILMLVFMICTLFFELLYMFINEPIIFLFEVIFAILYIIFFVIYTINLIYGFTMFLIIKKKEK